MKKKDFYIGLCAFFAALFLNTIWNPEDVFINRTPLTMLEIRQNNISQFIGARPGADIPRLLSKEDFDTIKAIAITAQPIDVIFTGIFELKPWVDQEFTSRYKGRTTAVTKKPKYVINKYSWEILDPQTDYLQFYILVLSDKTKILAQIPKKEANAIRQKEALTLSIGRKISKTLPADLKSICVKYNVSERYIYYAFDDEWNKKRQPILQFFYYGVFILLFVVLFIVLNWLFTRYSKR